MPDRWIQALAHDPLPPLLEWRDPALGYLARRDLLDEPVGPAETLWELEKPASLLKKQQPDGAWRYPGKSYDPENGTNYDLLETFRNLRVLVHMWTFDSRHAAIPRAADYIFSYQTEEGDVRGILGNQYMPYYFGAMLELLIRVGLVEDARVIRGLDWLQWSQHEE